jgi:hypothetical protein
MVTSKRPFPIVFFLSVYFLGITLNNPLNVRHWLVITYCLALKYITPKIVTLPV